MSTDEMVSANIAAAIEGSGMTVEAVARELEVGERLVRRWRNGEVFPSRPNLERLADLFGRDVAWFYTDHRGVAA